MRKRNEYLININIYLININIYLINIIDRNECFYKQDGVTELVRVTMCDGGGERHHAFATSDAWDNGNHNHNFLPFYVECWLTFVRFS